MTIVATYEGSTPATSIKTAEQWFGEAFGATTAFTGDASWADYTGSINYAVGMVKGAAATTLWSIPLFASGSSLAQAGSGADNSYFVTAAKELLASQPTGSIYVRTGWEFNIGGQVWAAGSDSKDYIAAFQQFVDSFRTVSNRFVFTWSPAEASGGYNPANYYPGNAYVDIIGMDVYDNNYYDGAGNAAFQSKLTAQYGLNWLVSFAAEMGKPVSIPEWGVNSNTDAAFVTDMAQWLANNHAVYQSYWDSNASFNGLLSSMPAVQAAFIAAFGANSTITASATAPATPAAVAAPTLSTAPAIALLVGAEAHGMNFDGSAEAGVIWRNSTTGDVQLWESSRGLSASHSVDLGVVGLNQQIAGIGDFDGDGKADILWRDVNTGSVSLWETGTGLSAAHNIDLGVVALNQTIVGVGDFDGDGKADILWKSAGGEMGLWESTVGLSASKYIDLGNVGANTTVAGVGDFDGDQKSDILFRNTSTGAVTLWESALGLSPSHAVNLGVVGLNQSIVGVADFDGDGKADILWRSAGGEVGLWESTQGLSAAHYVDLGNVTSNWQVMGVGDYDGDGKADILWRNTTNGDVQVWESSHGLSAAHSIDLGIESSSLTIATHIYSSIL